MTSSIGGWGGGQSFFPEKGNEDMLLDALIIPAFNFFSTKCWYKTRVWNLMHAAHFLCYKVSLRVAQTHSRQRPHSHSPHSVFLPRKCCRLRRRRRHHHHHQRLLLALVKDVALSQSWFSMPQSYPTLFQMSGNPANPVFLFSAFFPKVMRDSLNISQVPKRKENLVLQSEEAPPNCNLHSS